MKFRAKRIDNNQWIQGSICKNMNGGYSIMPQCFFGTVVFTNEEETEYDTEENGLSLGGWFDVIEDTIGQLSKSLTNKAGNEIYEGDIISHDLREGLGEPELYGLESTVNSIEGDWFYYTNVKLIGNIHDKL